jgi:predicted flap endonuclease-1-like 5' DNA nuclease
MSQKSKDTSRRAADSLERAAYAAIGAPVAAVKGLSTRVSELRDTLSKSRAELGEDLAEEIEGWVAQGEEVIARAMKRIRSSNVAGDIRSSADSTRKAVQAGLDKARDSAESGLRVVEPDESLTTIKGVGPGYADRLRSAGVSGIADLLALSESDIEKVASTSGLGVESVSGWRDRADLTRIDGVGSSYQTLLHRVGVWTLDQLAEVKPSDLVEQMRSIDLPDAPDQMPTESTVKGWRTEARKLAS